MEKIEVRGKELLNMEELTAIDMIPGSYIEKIKRVVKEIRKIEINIKKYNQKGFPRFSINSCVFLKTRKFQADSEDWNFKTSLRSSFEKILNQINHARR
ncbi:MAG: hypothetical protein Q8P79_02015 [Nanoarchaeota archaeon]|nr:hypothetical protein [Nanoarchaeota archaeon]